MVTATVILSEPCLSTSPKDFYSPSMYQAYNLSEIIIWLLHNLVEASFDLFRYLLLGDQLKPWELHA